MDRTIPAWLALAAMLAVIPAPGQAQDGPPARGPMQMMLASPAQVALDLRAELALSDEQVARLETLRTAWNEAHGPEIERLRERMGAMQSAREGARAERTRPERQGARARMRPQRTPTERGRSGERPMQGMGERMDPEVRAAMATLREARQEQARAVNDLLDDDQVRALRERMRPRGAAARRNRPDGR